MATALLILQMVIVLALVGIILIQKSSSDGLSGLSGGGHNMISSRAASNFLTKTTAVLAMAFMINSLALAKFAVQDTKETTKVIESIKTQVPKAQ
jgi:preprotein translocase subunit SecG